MLLPEFLLTELLLPEFLTVEPLPETLEEEDELEEERLTLLTEVLVALLLP